MSTFQPSIVLRALLSSAGYFTLPDVDQADPLYMLTLPDDDGVPDNAGCLYDRPSINEGRLMAGQQVERRVMQLKLRDLDYQAGAAKAEALAAFLDSKRRLVVQSGDYVWAFNSFMRDPVYFLGVEPNSPKRRYAWTINASFFFSEFNALTNLDGAELAVVQALEVVEVDFYTYFGEATEAFVVALEEASDDLNTLVHTTLPSLV